MIVLLLLLLLFFLAFAGCSFVEHMCTFRLVGQRLLVQPVQKVRGKVGQDDARTSPQEAPHRLLGHQPQVIDALFRPGVDHGKLARDLVDGGRVIGLQGRTVLDDVKVGKTRFDHEDVGAFEDVSVL